MLAVVELHGALHEDGSGDLKGALLEIAEEGTRQTVWCDGSRKELVSVPRGGGGHRRRSVGT